MLGNLDMIVNASKSDYIEIAELAGIDVGLFVESSLARGGCFWSERYRVPIPGVINHGNKVDVDYFVKGVGEMKS